MNFMWIGGIGALQAKKNKNLKYVFEEKPDNDKEPTKFYGYQDDAVGLSSGGNSTYAVMIYHVCHD